MTPNYLKNKSPLFPENEGYVNTIQSVICVGSGQDHASKCQQN